MVFHFTKYEILKPECTKDGFLNAGLLGIQTGTQCYVHLYSTQEQNTVYKRVLQMLLETFMNAYHVCIHKLLCLHIMRRKKNIRFLSLHNILGMFSFVTSKDPYSLFDEIYLIYQHESPLLLLGGFYLWTGYFQVSMKPLQSNDCLVQTPQLSTV